MGQLVIVNLRHRRGGILFIVQVVLFLSTCFASGVAIDLSYSNNDLANRFRTCPGQYEGGKHECHIESRLNPEETTNVLCPIPALPPPVPITTTTTSTPSTITTPTTTTPSTTTTPTTTTTTPTTTTTTTTPPPTTTPGNATVDPNASTTPTTTPTTTTTTTTPTTTVTTTTQTTTTTRPLGRNELPHHGNKCLDKPEYRNRIGRKGNESTWDRRLTERIMENDYDLFEPCDIYFRATTPEFPNPDYGNDTYIPGVPHGEEYRKKILNDLSCNSPFSTFTTDRKDLVLGLDMREVQKSLMPLKQRRTERNNWIRNVSQPMDCLTTFLFPQNGSWMSAIDTVPIAIPGDKIPVPETCLHCPKTTQLDTPRKPNRPARVLRDTFQVMRGKIVPFALKGKTCSLENEAYLHGAVLASIAQDDNFGKNLEDMVEGFPWGRLHKYWPRLVNLHVADIDKDGKEPECAKGDYYTKILHGDCVFNQRLATDPHEIVENNEGQIHMCRGSHTLTNLHQPPYNLKVHQYTYDIPIVALGCAPHHYLFCNQDYNFDQMMESTCICHPLYAVEDKKNNTDPTKKPPCLPMAGVPCMFDRDESSDFGRILFAGPLECAPNMECKSLKEINMDNLQNKSNWQLFEKTFVGFGMSPIARDYMVSRATGMCVCEKTVDAHGNKIDKYIQTPFNECLEARTSGGEMVHFRQGGWMNGKELLIGVLLAARNIF